MGKKILRKKKRTRPSSSAAPRCGLCGKRGNLTRTPCCGNWICDDEHKYVMFSHARNSCYRNHARYTLCGQHFSEEHEGDWKDCPECRDGQETEWYVYYGTNEYNFEKLPNPPEYDPTHCSECGRVIRMGRETITTTSDGYICQDCTLRRLGHIF